MIQQETRLNVADNTGAKEALFNMRFQKSLQQLDYPMAIRIAKRDIARIKTRMSAINNKREV